MSEFLMVVPEGWTGLADSALFLEQQGEQQILDLLARDEGYGAIEALMQDGGFIPMDASIADFRMFKDGIATRIWYRLV